MGFFKYLPVWIYELFRFCPFKRSKTSQPEFLIIGHRGAAAYEIENTIPAMEQALTNYHANALEIDISMTKDNEIVLWHDWDPDNLVAKIRQMGLEPYVKYRPYVPMSGIWRKPVNKLFLSELREHYGYALKNKYPEKLKVEIPILQDFLDFTVNKPNLKAVLFDIKIPLEEIDVVALFIHLFHTILEKYQPQFEVILLSTVEPIIRSMKKYLPGNFYSLDVELPLGIVLDPYYFSSVKKAIFLNNGIASIGRPTILNLGPWTTYRRVLKYDIAEKQKYNDSQPEISINKLISWTINRKREMKCLLKMGVDGILTDKPDRLNNIFN